ncbi:hypothetical protein AYO21_02964 [Fonsecaea monophora]|uniref:Major facilitator superfamily (MFS) profile domain-containing protein n=1 Tax=Fonsecaea monophora TaxID=254056 RepID=A0A177FG37_9EURO|nr:hypothetical protein AYO21_02964 [Fonsecaea monophora]OAG42681.1 hypothetical protein AYO21_02964 [Fonsecaea monophora]
MTEDTLNKLDSGSHHYELKETQGDSGTETPQEQAPLTRARTIMALIALSITYEACLFAFIVPTSVLLTINADIGPSNNIGWVATAWQLANAVLQAIAGRLSDIFGRRKFLIFGNLVALVGTIVASRAQSVGTLIAATTLMGVGASHQQIAYAAGFDVVQRKHRGAAVALMNLAALPGSAFGAVIGTPKSATAKISGLIQGLYTAFKIVETLNWRYTFYFGIMVNGLALCLILVFYWPPGWHGLHLDGKTRKQQLKELDYVGLLLFGGGLTIMLIGLSFGGNPHPWTSATVLAPLIIGTRPDFVAAVHCHSVASKAFAALGCELEPLNQDACRFYNDHGIYSGFGGIAFNPDEGEHIAAALDDKKVFILQNRGHLAVAKTVDGAAFLFGAMDRCIQTRLLADAAATGRGTKTIKVGHEEAEFTRKTYNDEMVYIMFQSAFEDVIRASNGELPSHVLVEIRRK